MNIISWLAVTAVIEMLSSVVYLTVVTTVKILQRYDENSYCSEYELIKWIKSFIQNEKWIRTKMITWELNKN